jgi:cytochrome c-type biogenesis protein CcmH/NrfG
MTATTHQREQAVRIAAALFALLVCSWFALGVWQTTNLSHAEAIINARKSANAQEVRTVDALLDDAGVLNPDRQVELDRVHILLEHLEFNAAAKIAREVVSAEPQNIEAWLWLARASGGRQPLFGYALHRAYELEPLIP